jgi:hypothetical protein
MTDEFDEEQESRAEYEERLAWFEAPFTRAKRMEFEEARAEALQVLESQASVSTDPAVQVASERFRRLDLLVKTFGGKDLRFGGDHA